MKIAICVWLVAAACVASAAHDTSANHVMRKRDADNSTSSEPFYCVYKDTILDLVRFFANYAPSGLRDCLEGQMSNVVGSLCKNELFAIEQACIDLFAGGNNATTTTADPSPPSSVAKRMRHHEAAKKSKKHASKKHHHEGKKKKHHQ